MHTKNPITVAEIVNSAHNEILRLGYHHSTASRHSKQLRDFSSYCEKKSITFYDERTSQSYFVDKYGLQLSDAECRLTQAQLQTRCTLRMLDDIYQFGYAHRNSRHDYSSTKYDTQLKEYLEYCRKSNASSGTIRTKRTRLRHFLSFIEGRNLSLFSLTAANLSDYAITLSPYRRSTIHVAVSVISCFLRYLHDSGYMETDISTQMPKPKIYAEENIPQIWASQDVKKLLLAIDRTNPVGKRDYAMILLAVIYGMRAGDICLLTFKNFDWNRMRISYVQQKCNKINTLPILPEVFEAIVDYLKNGRLETDSEYIFIRHIHPYDRFLSGSALSQIIKKYMRYAGIEIQPRKVAHSLRHALAGTLLSNGIPFMTISNILGHHNPRTTSGYTKVDISALRKCSLSYGERTVSI